MIQASFFLCPVGVTIGSMVLCLVQSLYTSQEMIQKWHLNWESDLLLKLLMGQGQDQGQWQGQR